VWSVSPGIKRPERAHHSAFSGAEVKPIWSYTPPPHIFVPCLPVIFQTDCSIDIVLTAVWKLQPTLHRVRMVDALAGEEILRAINLARIEGGGERLCARSAVRRGIHRTFV
jgi:hypothetical protein